MKILFICSSNICRSPFCEFEFRRMVNECPELAEIVTSVKSGAVKFRYKRIYEMTAQCLIADGFTPEEVYAHKPRHKWFEKEVFEEADLIIGMSRQHYVLLPRKWKRKYVNFTEYLFGEYKPVKDPWWERDLDQNGFNARMAELKEYLVLLKEKLLKEKVV